MDESGTSWVGVDAWLSLHLAEIGGCIPALTKGGLGIRGAEGGPIFCFRTGRFESPCRQFLRARELLDRRVPDPVQVC